jgi:membrane-bound lytic murein transglycosylase A
MRSRFLLLTLTLTLCGCVEQPVKSENQQAVREIAVGQSSVSQSSSATCGCRAEEVPPIQIPDVDRFTPPAFIAVPGEAPKGREYDLLRRVEWSQLEGFDKDNLAAAWAGLVQSCGALKKNELWQSACEAISKQSNPTSYTIRLLLKELFLPWQVTNPDGTNTGLITGYYEPLLKGSRSRTERYRYPLYSRPDDMVTVELSSLYPELSNRKLRGRIKGNKLIPYYSRGEIDIVPSPIAGKELLWTDDIVDLFFLQIQGSGLIKLDSGELVHVGYDDQNGQPYQSIGKVLIERGELTSDKASMQGIKDWGRKNLDKLRDLLNSNPSYVFFHELPKELTGPPGALGIPLAAERSIAVDPRYIPLGAPVFLSATFPNSSKPLQRLMMAQDTGGAIKGAVRADFFWGTGNEAGKQAGAMKQQGKLWVLMPKNYKAEINSASP